VNNPESDTQHDAEVQQEAEERIGDALREAAVNGTAELRRKTTRDAFATRLFLVVGIGMLVVAVVFAYVTLKAVRDTQHAAIEINRQTRACVTPGTVCYERTQQQNQALITAVVAGVIGGINESSLYYSYCTARPGPQTLHDIKACANRLLHPN
jgi:hypothetical protein